MRKFGKRLCSEICVIALLLTCVVPGLQSFSADYAIGILDENGGDVTGTVITLEEAKNTKCSVTYIDCSAPNGSEIRWSSVAGLIASVDEDGTIRARDSSRQARLQYWIDSDVKSIRGVGQRLGEQVEDAAKELDVETASVSALWNAFAPIFADLSQATQSALYNELEAKMGIDSVPITATLVDHNGQPLTSAVVYVNVIQPSNVLSQRLPNGSFITNKDSLPTVVAVGTTLRIQNVITPVRLGMETQWSLSTDSVVDLASQYASITDDGIITFKKAGTVTVTASPEFELFLSKIVDFLTDSGDGGVDYVSEWLIDTLGLDVSQSTVSTALSYVIKLGLKLAGVSQYVSYATIGNTVLKFLSNALMKARTNDKITFTIVDDLPLQSFDISCSDSYREGDREQLYITDIDPAGALLGETTWQSSDPGAASISEDGFLRIMDAGGENEQKTVSVTATLNNVSVTKSFTITGAGNEPAAIEVEGPTHVMPGHTGSYTATVYPSRADQTVQWGTKSEAGFVDYASPGSPVVNKYLRIDSDGTVTGLALGVTEIYVRASNGVTDTFTVNVGAAVTGITLAEAPAVTYTVPIYNTYNETVKQLNATLRPDNVANSQIKWSLSDSSNLVLTQDGQVHPADNKAAYGTVTVRSVDGGFTASARVAFVNVAVTGVELSESNVFMKAGKKMQLVATVKPDNTITGATIKDVTWESDSPDVAVVDENGWVYAVDRGTATITCKTVDGLKQAQCVVEVEPDKDALHALIALADEIDLDSIDASQEAIDAFVAALAQARTVDTDIYVYQATIDEAYEALAEAYEALTPIVEPETVTITADGAPVQEYDAVTVGLVEDYRNASRQYGYEILPHNALVRSVTWSSSNENVPVTQDGLLSPTVNKAQYTQVTVTVTNHRGWEITDSVYLSFVYKPVTSLTFAQTEITGISCETGKIDYTIEPKGVAGVNGASITDLMWETSDPSVVTVDDDGTLHFGSIGSATVKATTYDGGKTASCAVTVVLDRSALQQKLNESGQLSEGAYTPESWRDMIAVRSRALAVYQAADDEITQPEINAATAELTAAMRALVLIQDVGSVTLMVNGEAIGDTYTVAVTGGVTSVDLDHRVSPTDATVVSVSYSSASSAVTVTQDGVCTPVYGTPCVATVSVAVTDFRGNVVTDSVKLCFAERPAASVSVTPSEYIASSVNDSVTLEAVVLAADGQPASIQDVRWVSGSQSILVSADGKLTFLECGVGTVTAYSVDGEFSASATITVLADKSGLRAALDAADGAGIVPSDYTIETYTAFADAYQTANEIYDSTAYTQAQIDNAAADLLAALAALEPIITIESVTITHNGAPASKYNSIKVPLSSSYKNQSFSLGYVYSPSDAEFYTVTWSSSDSNMTVNQNGTVSPAKNSAVAAKITLTITDYYGRQYSDWVYVSFANYPVTGVTVSPTTLTLPAGQSTTLTYEIAPKGTLNIGSASIKTVVWESSDPTVATVNQGAVTAVDGGVAQIRCIAVDGGVTGTCTVTVTVDKSELVAAIEQANAVNGAAYTQDSYAALQSAVQAGGVIVNKTTATTAEVEGAADAILAAIDGLQIRPADYSAVTAAVDAFNALIPNRYTPETYSAVRQAVGEVIYDLPYSQQARVDAMAQAINEALDGLIERPETHLTVVEGSGGVVDEDARIVYGVLPGSPDVSSYFTATEEGSINFTPAFGGAGTGSLLTLRDKYGDTVGTYTLVIFGDVNGDSFYNCTDAYFVSLLANGAIPAHALTDAQRLAADCNHDGSVDTADVKLLERAGLLLDRVDQTVPIEDMRLDEMYIEYCSLIDQTIEADETAPEEEPEPVSAGFLQALFDAFMKILSYIFTVLPIRFISK